MPRHAAMTKHSGPDFNCPGAADCQLFVTFPLQATLTRTNTGVAPSMPVRYAMLSTHATCDTGDLHNHPRLSVSPWSFPKLIPSPPRPPPSPASIPLPAKQLAKVASSLLPPKPISAGTLETVILAPQSTVDRKKAEDDSPLPSQWHWSWIYSERSR